MIEQANAISTDARPWSSCTCSETMCFIVLCCQKNLTYRDYWEESSKKLGISGCWHDFCLAVCRDDDLHPDKLTEQCEGKCQDFEPTYPTQDYVLPDEEQFPSWRNLIHVYRFHHCPVFRLGLNHPWVNQGSMWPGKTIQRFRMMGPALPWLSVIVHHLPRHRLTLTIRLDFMIPPNLWCNSSFQWVP